MGVNTWKKKRERALVQGPVREAWPKGKTLVGAAVL